LKETFSLFYGNVTFLKRIAFLRFHKQPKRPFDYQHIMKSAPQAIVAHFYFNTLSVNKLHRKTPMKLYFLL